ncbi:UDP-2,4-diacetamido-2,4,6-trideoxy-beta-L-altropyranose hydrolase [Anaeroselena agilis]|uniref:UDP-2,4-diacetamido-2,4, 6-trideoxy-beta-L-altropyranose hydrolase n=1 Tax=Anaeroselena agilis TaxID=3063788 RepID=A0ABU3P4H2_9FIRM|nr:UDP-2,4-diacetamido-2,4,6-trideoxy-beta-L-altropyranose hydrolase [Selenomonadales bacterium 4137-cl]
MNIAIRADASTAIGIGHLMRCLTMAEELKEKSCRVLFISRRLPDNAAAAIRAKHRLRLLPDDLSWEEDAELTGDILRRESFRTDRLIVDNYRLDARWETSLRPYSGKIMVIDDLADRPHDCDLLLDQNYYRDAENRYDGLLPGHCRRFFGPRFALLRREFREARKRTAPRDGKIRRLFVFFGGTDPTGETLKTLTALREWCRPDIAADIVVGGDNPRREEIRQACATLPQATFHCQIDNIAALMAHADLAVGTGGTASWERCSLGLPALLVVAAPNQAEVAANLHAAGAGWLLGDSATVAAGDIAAALEKAAADQPAVRQASQQAARLMGEPGFDGMDAILQALMEDDHAAL